MFVKKNNLIYFITAALLLLYFFSFCKSCTGTDKRELINSALINPKYNEELGKFQFIDSNNKLELFKKNNIWFVQNIETEICYPAEAKKVQNFINDITSVKKMYKISDKNSANDSFGVFSSSAFIINYYLPSGFHKISFGNQDFSLDNRFITSDKATTVYEIDSSMDKYLSTSIQNWAEPYIISQEIFSRIVPSDIQNAQLLQNNLILPIKDYSKLLELRHGGIPSNILTLTETPDSIIQIELGNKKNIRIEIFSTQKENEYLIKSNYISENSSQFFYSHISGWTYNKIREITL